MYFKEINVKINKTIKMSFEKWKFMVDGIVYLILGFRLDDLPDENYHINYENGIHVCDMAKIVITNNK